MEVIVTLKRGITLDLYRLPGDKPYVASSRALRCQVESLQGAFQVLEVFQAQIGDLWVDASPCKSELLADLNLAQRTGKSWDERRELFYALPLAERLEGITVRVATSNIDAIVGNAD